MAMLTTKTLGEESQLHQQPLFLTGREKGSVPVSPGVRPWSVLLLRGQRRTMAIMRFLPPLAFAVLALIAVGCGDHESSSGGGGTSTAQSDCHVRFAMTDGELTGEFQAIIDYSRTTGHFVGVNTDVECVRLDSRAAVYGANQCTGPDGECRNRDHTELYVVAQTTQQLSAPLDLLDCHFVGSKDPTIDDFVLADVFATDAHGAPATPPPTVAVTEITCVGPETTTTTLPATEPCGDVECPSGEACVDGECIVTNHYRVELQTDAAATYAALQLDMRYDCRDGHFDGLGDMTVCRTAPTVNAYAAFNNVPCLSDSDSSTLTAGVISLLGWPGPGPFISCDYTSATGEPPAPESFHIEIVEALNLEDKPVKNAAVSVSAIRPIAP